MKRRIRTMHKNEFLVTLSLQLTFVIHIMVVNTRNEILDPYLSGVLDENNTFRNIIRLAVAEIQTDGDGDLKINVMSVKSGLVSALA